MRWLRLGFISMMFISCELMKGNPQSQGGGESLPSYEHQTGSWHRGDHTCTVGFRYHSSLLGHCTMGKWYFDRIRVATGQLPPGLNIESDGTISGVPEQEGTWHCTIVLSALRCDCGTMQQYQGEYTMWEGFYIVR